VQSLAEGSTVDERTFAPLVSPPVDAPFQPSLLDDGPDIELSSRALGEVRTDLGNGAWVELESNWVKGSDRLFERLVDRVPWKAERRRMFDRMLDVPRLVAFYDEDQPLPHPALEAMKRTLSQHYDRELEEPFRTAGLCLYRNGYDSVAWHGDRLGRGSKDDTMVAIVSLGCSRRFLLRPHGGGRSRCFELGRGDLFVMGGSCQRTWEHSVPKLPKGSGPRISVQFRPRGVR
jgi:alkylated DNA repair dioxygenase AlkB